MANKQFKDYYSVLGLSRSATNDQIKEAYRKKAKEFHSDSTGDLSEAERAIRDALMVDINEAYDELGKGINLNQKKDTYDTLFDREMSRRSGPITERENVANAPRTPSRSEVSTSRPVAPSQTPMEDFISNFMNKRGGIPYGGNQEGSANSQSQQDFFKLAENDIGLLAGLIKAYGSKTDGIWEIKKSKKDTREWMPERVYRIKREGDKVHIFRAIKDWRSEFDRETEVRYKKENEPWNLDPEKINSPSVLLSEYYLYGKGKNIVDGSYTAPYNYLAYIDGLKKLAYMLSRPSAEGVQTIHSDIIKAVNSYAETNFTKVKMEGGFSFFDQDKEIGRVLSVENFWDELSQHKIYVSEVTNWKKEGQAKPPPESHQPRPGNEGKI